MLKVLIIVLIFMKLISCNPGKEKPDQEIKVPDSVLVVRIEPVSYIRKLPKKLKENSGIIIHKKQIWTFNDSGGDPILYGLSHEGKLIKEISLEQVKNNDWEDITQDSENIYIGDFGNNFGLRKDLRIYFFNKKEINDSCFQQIKPSIITFTFENYQNKGFNLKKSDYDCEALTEFNGMLYLFTKNWISNTTSVYTLLPVTGKQTAKKTGSFNTKGLVTGADISPDKTKLALSGYNKFGSFTWIFEGITNEKPFGVTQTYCTMGKFRSAQTEGICFLNNDTILVSCERNKMHEQQLFSFNVKNITQ